LIFLNLYLIFSPLFFVKHLKINDLSDLSKEEILKLSSSIYGKNIFTLRISKIKRELLNHSFIESVFIKKIYPDKIEIQIKKREPVARVGIFLVDEKGVLFKKKVKNMYLPKITGSSLKEKDRLRRIVKILKILSYTNFSKFLSCAEIKKKNLILYFKNFKVYLAEENPFSEIEKLLIILNHLNSLGKYNQIDLIDLRFKNLGVVRLKGGETFG